MDEQKAKLTELLMNIPQVNHAEAQMCGMRYVFECCAEYLIANGLTFATGTNVGGNRIPYSDRVEIYSHALMAYGQEAQMIVAIEELSEVQKELCKVMRGKGNMEHLAEEIADATIMLEQMRYGMGLNEKVCRYMDEKVRRLDDNLTA